MTAMAQAEKVERPFLEPHAPPQLLTGFALLSVLSVTVITLLVGYGVFRVYSDELIQGARKDAGFDVSDRIHLRYEGDEAVTAALEAHREYVAAQVLALSIEPGRGEVGAFAAEGEVGATRAKIAVQRAT